MVSRDQELPHTGTKWLTTCEDNQDIVNFKVVEGERAFANLNLTVRDFNFRLKTKSKKGVDQFKIDYSLNQNGEQYILCVAHVSDNKMNATIDIVNVELCSDHLHWLSFICYPFV